MESIKCKIFNCKVGSIYRMPFNTRMEPMVRLSILENLGHNSIKTKCLDCGEIDTYAKSDLENGNVYLCKTCGKNSIYSTEYARLSIEKVKNKDGNPIAVCKCEYCNSQNEFPLIQITYGKIMTCKNCLAGVYVGKKFGKIKVSEIRRNVDTGESGVSFICTECGEKAGVVKLSRLINLLKHNKDISKMAICKCSKEAKAKIQSDSSIQKSQNIKSVKMEPRSVAKNIEIPKETDDFTNIELSRDGVSVVAECKNCGIRKKYSLKHIIEDYDPCDICKGLMIGDRVAKRDITDAYLSKQRLTEESKEHVAKMKKRFELNISNISLMKNDFLEAREAKQKYKPAVYCKCNNCNIENRYEADNIDTDIDKCNACDFDILIGTVVGDKRRYTERIIKGIRLINNKPSIDMECTTCNTKLTLSKIDYLAVSLDACPICKFREANNIDESNKIIGNILSLDGTSIVNGYERVGKYIILDKIREEGKYRIKAQCCECGVMLDDKYDNVESFTKEYESGRCDSCESLMVGTRNYINNNNWLGYIKNCRVVEKVFIEDGIKKVEVKCMLCNDIKTIPLTVFIYSDYCVCEHCRDRKLIMRCPSCKGIHDNKLTLGELYTDESTMTITKKLMCPVTRHTAKISVYRQYHEEQSRLDFLMANYSELGDIKRVPGGSGLMRSTDKFYEGSDGNKYYTCYCERHNKFMTLREDEMTTYDHLYCADTRMYGYM